MLNVSTKKTAKARPQPIEPRATEPPDRVPWGPWMAVIYSVLVYFAAQILAALIVILYPHLRGWTPNHGVDWFDNSVIAQFWIVLFAEVLTVAAIWWFVRQRRSSLRVLGWRRPRWMDIVSALAGFAVYFVVYAALFAIVTALVPSLNSSQKQELGFQNATGGLDLTLAFISLAILPPLAEETVFRGFIFGGLKTKLSPIKAAALTSLLFAVAHLEFGTGKPLLWVAGLDVFTLSLVLCYLRQKTHSLWPGILLHALKNSIAFVALFLVH